MFDKRKDTAKQPDPVPSSMSQSTESQFTQTPSQVRSTAVIGQTIQIKGTISGAENLVIEGAVEGSIDLPDHDLTIGQTGTVTADLKAKIVKVEGQVTGDINGSEKVIVSKSGRVRGNITAPRVTLEDGAKFKGSIDMDPGEPKSKAPAKFDAKPASTPTGATQEAG